MSYDRNLSTYRETSVMGSSREQLVPLLYEHLLVNLKRAAAQIRQGDLEGKAQSFSNASAIVYELLAALDFDRGGELASRLASLYAFWTQEISDISRTLDLDRLDQLIELVQPLHESWVEAARAAGQERAAGGAA
ncbi:MAG: flagellar export chaperone FliS [Gemmatimonadetes bacterium]|nr:MAG: flagellar export chaperone FliS [Gemmatimonadota bacterium]